MIASSVSYTFALTNIIPNAPHKNSSKKSLSTIFVVVDGNPYFPQVFRYDVDVDVVTLFTGLTSILLPFFVSSYSTGYFLDLDLDFEAMKEMNQNK